jgi:hypothetical protein
MFSWVGKIVLVCAVLFLMLVAGSSAMWFGFFPGPQLQQSFQAWEALSKMQRQQKRSFNAGGVYPADHDFGGVTRSDPQRWQDGYTLYSTAQGQSVNLVNMAGELVHRWELSYHDMWDADSTVQNLVPEQFIYVRNARLYPNGDILLSFSAWTTTPFGYGISKNDRDSKVLWKNFQPIHHSFDEAEDGTIYALDHHVINEPPAWLQDLPGPYLDDGIAILTPDGEFIKRLSLLEALKNSVYRPVIPVLAFANATQGLGDLLHANDVEVLTTELAPLYPFAQAGDLLVSLREISAIAIVSVEQEAVTWLARGNWHAQHDPDFLANGNILLFNNIDLQLNESGERVSSVIEFNPQTQAVEWSFSGTQSEPLYTSARGSQQRLPNGNTLITESQGGRIIEVTNTGEVVWEYYNPDRYGPNNNQMPSIFWASRYEASTIDFAFNQLTGPDTLTTQP